MDNSELVFSARVTKDGTTVRLVRKEQLVIEFYGLKSRKWLHYWSSHKADDVLNEFIRMTEGGSNAESNQP